MILMLADYSSFLVSVEGKKVTLQPFYLNDNLTITGERMRKLFGLQAAVSHSSFSVFIWRGV